MDPNKPPVKRRVWCELLDIYNLKNLITSPTRTTEKQQQSRSHSYKQQEKNTVIGRGWRLNQWSLTRIQNFKTLRTQISILKNLWEKIKSLTAMLSYKIYIMLLSM